MSWLVAIALMQGVVRIGPPTPTQMVVDPAPVFATFREVCVEPFPDAAGFTRAVSSRPELTRWQPSSAIEAAIPGEIWRSAMLTIRFNATAAYGSNLPVPQCTLTATAPINADQDALILRYAGVGGLAVPKIRGRNGTRMAMWDNERGHGVRWRTIFTTERRNGRVELRLAQMNLGTKS